LLKDKTLSKIQICDKIVCNHLLGGQNWPSHSLAYRSGRGWPPIEELAIIIAVFSQNEQITDQREWGINRHWTHNSLKRGKEKTLY
jgi:hypothetical protein